MNQNRKGQDGRNQQSSMKKAEDSHTQAFGGERNRSSDSSTSSRGSVMDDKESFEHGSRESEMTRGMGSAGERGHAHDPASSKRADGRQTSKRVTSLDDLPAPGWKMEER